MKGGYYSFIVLNANAPEMICKTTGINNINNAKNNDIILNTIIQIP